MCTDRGVRCFEEEVRLKRRAADAKRRHSGRLVIQKGKDLRMRSSGRGSRDYRCSLDYRNIRPCGGRPRRTWPTVSKWIGRPWPCWVPAWMSRSRRSNGFSLKTAVEPAAP